MMMAINAMDAQYQNTIRAMPKSIGSVSNNPERVALNKPEVLRRAGKEPLTSDSDAASIETDDENISEFLKLLEQKKELKSFKPALPPLHSDISPKYDETPWRRRDKNLKQSSPKLSRRFRSPRPKVQDAQAEPNEDMYPAMFTHYTISQDTTVSEKARTKALLVAVNDHPNVLQSKACGISKMTKATPFGPSNESNMELLVFPPRS